MTDTQDDTGFGEEVWNIVCELEIGLVVIFVLNTVLLILSVVAVPFVQPGTATYVVLQFDLLIIAVVFLITGGALYKCR